MSRERRAPRVVYWNNMPAPYVVERFAALERRGALDFEAWFSSRREPDRSWEVREETWPFRWRYLGRDPATPPSPLAAIRALRAGPPELLVGHYSSVAWATGLLAARRLGCRTAFRVLPSWDSWVRRRRWKETAKRFLFARVDGIKTPGPDGARLARSYGVPDERIHFVTQSIDVARFAAGLPPGERERRRQELGLEGPVFLYVGRLWRGKGVDCLLTAYREVSKAVGGSLLLVGDGVDEERYRRLARDLPGVRFAGFAQPSEIAGWYALGDVFAFPTLGDPHGLVVEEAMAAGLPVVASRAAGDIERRLDHGGAGFVVEPGDAAALADKLLALGHDSELRRRLGEHGRRLATERGHERWVTDFERFVERTLALPRRGEGHAEPGG